MKACQHSDQSIQESCRSCRPPNSTDRIEFDPALLRLDMSPEEAFSLTKVVSSADYERLTNNLNIASPGEVTATYTTACH